MIFYTTNIATSPYFKSSARVETLDMLEPITRAGVESILDAAKDNPGPPLIVYESYRAQERQDLLRQENDEWPEKPGPIAYGCAAYFGFDLGNGQFTDEGDFGFLQELASSAGLLWGPDVGAPANYVTIVPEDKVEALQEGVWYPEATAPATEQPAAESTPAAPA